MLVTQFVDASTTRSLQHSGKVPATKRHGLSSFIIVRTPTYKSEKIAIESNRLSILMGS